jgi:6-phosphogluconate dehydrogenase
LPSLVVDGKIAGRTKTLLPSLRQTIRTAVDMGIPVPCLSASLAYLESLRTGSLPTNLIQAQRDFFGAHGFERVDGVDKHHGPWGSGLADFS